MINANELRIGSLVLDRGGKILTVDRFYGNKIECDVKGMPDKDPLTSIPIYYHPLTEEIEYLQPIPLTEEWLLKFGFDVNTDYASETHVWHDYLKNYVRLSLPYFTFSIENGESEIEVKYVHQLQNLYFALTNEELTYGQ